METHKVFNQAKPLVDYNMFESDVVLAETIERYGAAWARERLISFGRYAGSQQAQEWAIDANTVVPKLERYTAQGERSDFVKFDRAYHDLMAAAVAAGGHCLPWADPRPGAHVARAAIMFMDFQNEAGHCCPISMTYSVVPSLRKQPALAALWLPRLLSFQYDGRFLPAEQKLGATMGMGMTEKQGGSDVRANTTRAVFAGKTELGLEYLLTGHKWFTSAPMSDAFLVLAQAEKGLSCFLVPRFRPDGSKNNLIVDQLKDKLGNRSNASSELLFDQTSGWLIGEEGRGVATIIEMVSHTRLDCTIGSAALMRQATLRAMHHCFQRAAFGRKLFEQPLMQNVLADLALESEAATRLMMRVAASYDSSEPSELMFKRLAGSVAKYWLCKRGPMHVAEALECFGGNGYVETGPMPRLFRESPLLGIWEGSGNVISLDILRAAAKEPQAIEAVLAELEGARGHSRRLDSHLKSVKSELQGLSVRPASTRAAARAALRREYNARRLTERLALALQASLMVRHAPSFAADAFVASRLGNQSGYAFGTLAPSTAFGAILERAYTLV